MSAAGVKKAAEVFAAMQTARLELIAMSAQPDGRGPVDRQDVYLGQLFRKINDYAKDDFSRIVMGEQPQLPI